MIQPKVYLAGAVNVGDYNARAWRDYTTDYFDRNKIITLNPIQNRIIPGHFYEPKEIVESDLALIDQSNLILAELNWSEHAYIGTAMEIRYAYTSNRPVVTWGIEHRQHYWIRYHSYRNFAELDEALKFIVKYFK